MADWNRIRPRTKGREGDLRRAKSTDRPNLKSTPNLRRKRAPSCLLYHSPFPSTPPGTSFNDIWRKISIHVQLAWKTIPDSSFVVRSPSYIINRPTFFVWKLKVKLIIDNLIKLRQLILLPCWTADSKGEIHFSGHRLLVSYYFF